MRFIVPCSIEVLVNRGRESVYLTAVHIIGPTNLTAQFVMSAWNQDIDQRRI